LENGEKLLKGIKGPDSNGMESLPIAHRKHAVRIAKLCFIQANKKKKKQKGKLKRRELENSKSQGPDSNWNGIALQAIA
jgi:hypothetical protein